MNSNLQIILDKLENKKYETLSSLYTDLRNLGLGDSHPIVVFIEQCKEDTSIGESKVSKYLLTSDSFNKSMSVVLRLAMYLDEENMVNTNYEILFDRESESPILKSLTFFDKGTMMLETVPNYNIINFSYARKMEQGIPTITGRVKITKYEKNTKTILDSLFSIH